MREVDMERLRAYEKLLAIPIDKPLIGNLGSRLTQQGKEDRFKIENMKSQFVGYLMRRELEMKGELE